jgi:NAD(P)-dependent dehydrogenase (short-subunit alcohol dehydrogenase family)
MQVNTKTAIVTGASSGIGLALAEAFLDRGYVVIGNARIQSRLKKAQGALGSPDRFVPVEGDIGRPEVGFELAGRTCAP